jgi:peptidoglycan/LPS O-acetylase OafA/YrhL
MFFHDLEYYFSADVSHGFTLIQGFKGASDLTAYDYVRPGWSIGVEICFYLIAPFFIRNMRVIMSLAIVSLLVNLIWIHLGAKFEPWRCMFFPSVLYLFMMGAMAYHIFLGDWLKKINWKDALLAITFMIIMLFVSKKVNADRPLYFTFEPLKFLEYALVIPILFSITKNFKFDRLVGELSYPVYLSHVLIYTIILSFGLPATKITGTLALIVSIAISFVLTRVVEIPIDKWRHRSAKRLMGNAPKPLQTDLPTGSYLAS